MSWLGKGLVAAARARVLQRSFAAKNPRRHQERALFELIARAKATAFGRAHGFDRIASLRDYRLRVPLYRYEDLKPWFARALDGEANVVWPGKIAYFGMSSGTTAGNKYLPISSASIQQQRRGGFESIASYLSWTYDAALLDSKGLFLGGSSHLEQRPNGVLVGDNTGIMARHMPRLVASKYLPSEAARKLSDWDTKIARVAKECHREDVRLIAGTPSWFPGLFDAVLAEARRAERSLNTIVEVWPNLRLLTGGGVSYEPYRSLIEARLGRSIPYVETYNATEGGIMGVQDRRDDRSMLLLPDNGIFYEFVTLDEHDKPNARRLALWEVELEVPYVILVTTMSGIFSYAIGDTIKFTHRFPHRFVFEGRVQAFVNLQGEHVSQGELERAVHYASQEHRSRIVDFTVTAELGLDGGSAGRHVLWVEFDGPLPDLTTFAQLIDRDLASGNDDYVTHRQSSYGLLPPIVRAVPRGTFHEWMRHQGKLGGQNKVPRLLKEGAPRALLDQLVAEAGHSQRNGHSAIPHEALT
jgi:hypothetical protein